MTDTTKIKTTLTITTHSDGTSVYTTVDDANGVPLFTSNRLLYTPDDDKLTIEMLAWFEAYKYRQQVQKGHGNE